MSRNSSYPREYSPYRESRAPTDRHNFSSRPEYPEYSSRLSDYQAGYNSYRDPENERRRYEPEPIRRNQISRSDTYDRAPFNAWNSNVYKQNPLVRNIINMITLIFVELRSSEICPEL